MANPWQTGGGQGSGIYSPVVPKPAPVQAGMTPMQLGGMNPAAILRALASNTNPTNTGNRQKVSNGINTGLEDYLFVPGAGNRNFKNPATGIISAPLTGNRATNQQSNSDNPYPAFAGNLADYLAQAQQLTGGGLQALLNDYAAKRTALQQQAQTGDQRIAAMYAALSNSTSQQNQADQARYAAAQAQSQQANQNALNAVNAANQSSQDNQAKQAALLGLSDPIADNSAAKTQSDYVQMNNSGIGTVGNAAVQNLITNGQAQGDYGSKMLTAGNFAGANNRAALQQALMNALSDLSGDEASVKANSNSQALSLAQQLYNNAYGQYQDQRNYTTGRDDEAWNRAYQQQQLNGSSSSSVDPSKLTGSDAAAYQLQQMGIDPATQQYILQQIAVAGGKANPGNVNSLFSQFYNAIASNPSLNDQQKNAAYAAASAAFGGYGK